LAPRWALVSIVLVSLILPAALHSTFAAPVAVTVSQNGAQLKMNLVFTENLTALPQIEAHIDASNSSQITTPIHDALQSAFTKLVPTATIDQLGLSVRTSNSSGTWRLSENYTIGVKGINTDYGSSIGTDTSFLSFNVTGPVAIDGYEINYAPKAYVLGNLTGTPPSQSTYYYINGHRTLTPTIPELTTVVLHLLDFTWVPLLTDWNENQNIVDQSTTWTYSLTGARYNLTLGTPSPEGTLLRAYEAVYNPSIQLTVPAGAWQTGKTVHFDIPSSIESLMPILTLLSLASLITTVVIDRRLQARPVKRRKR
jgi:hypothetical protein